VTPFVLILWLQAQNPPVAVPVPASADAQKRVELNLLGQADAGAGESRRNENVQFNLVDNNVLKELNVRLGVSATIVDVFRPDRSYFGAEYGQAPVAPIHVAAAKAANTLHGQAYWNHLNSVTSARTFFQVGGVKPAHENDYGFSVSRAAWRGAFVQVDASQQRLRGNVNGNVLVPRLDERTPLAVDPATRAIVERWLQSYPAELPNRTDVNPRALNTNAPQRINNSNAGLRLDQAVRSRDRVMLQYNWITQAVDAFQLVPGQNPDTDTRSHRARATWNRAWTAARVMDVSAAFDRVGSYLRPEPNAVGPMVSTGGLETLGPAGEIPLRRAMNTFKYAAQLRDRRGAHELSWGGSAWRRQVNGYETDAHRGFWSFANDFGRDSITNLRLGEPTQHILAIGDVNRGFRNNEYALYAGDTWKRSANLTLNFGLRWQGTSAPSEVNNRSVLGYGGDYNNVAPSVGAAYRLPSRWGVLRASGGVHYGEIFPATFQQVRFSPPGSIKLVVVRPTLFEPLNESARGNFYLLDPELATPYEYQYNAAWQVPLGRGASLQLGYVGSRAHKLLMMWYLNRARPSATLAQTTATINDRRPDPRFAETRWAFNGSRGFYDAARVSLVLPAWRGLAMDASYWFSKSMDLGASYTNTAQGPDSRLSRNQSEFEQQSDMRGRSDFDQPHAFLWRGSYTRRQWTLSLVTLLKQGTPFTVVSGSDAPGYGNVDGNGGDRPHVADVSVLGRTIGHPDTSRALLPRSAFVYMEPTDVRGNLGRNTFRKGAIRNVNASVARAFAWNGSKRITLRAESVNLLNTPQFAGPGVELANGNFGQITNTLNEGRTFRASLQFAW